MFLAVYYEKLTADMAGGTTGSQSGSFYLCVSAAPQVHFLFAPKKHGASDGLFFRKKSREAKREREREREKAASAESSTPRRSLQATSYTPYSGATRRTCAHDAHPLHASPAPHTERPSRSSCSRASPPKAETWSKKASTPSAHVQHRRGDPTQMRPRAPILPMQSSNVWSTWRASAGRRRAQTTITRASIIEHAASTCPAVSYSVMDLVPFLIGFALDGMVLVLLEGDEELFSLPMMCDPHLKVAIFFTVMLKPVMFALGARLARALGTSLDLR